MAADAAAPGELELVRAYVNTVDLESGDDELATPSGLSAWLGARGLAEAGREAGRTDLARAIAVREALRSLLAANNGAPVDREAVALLDAAARRARLALRFSREGPARLAPSAGGVSGALGRLLAITAESMAAGTWSRLKACREETCRWAFYDHARNRSRTWCSMDACGNRAKARAFRARRAR